MSKTLNWPPVGEDLATASGKPGVNRKKELALLKGFLAIAASAHFSNSKMPLKNIKNGGRIVKWGSIDGQGNIAAASAPGPKENYIDMAKVYRGLRPLKTDEVNSLVATARYHAKLFGKTWPIFHTLGMSFDFYDPDHGDVCLAMAHILAMK
jgi:hypothetical protein